ncbi:site-specific integrase [Streptomyces sp. B8F3]|uniref:site-specific integrase n=1 Tax=unclassified Streptomyces TaxID=2593676 RepID=UPI00325DBE4D
MDAARGEGEQGCCAKTKCCRRLPSARTVQYTHVVLRSALQQAVREVRILLKAARPHRLYPLWPVMVSTGLRRGEVLALTWDDIDLTTGRLRVRRNLQRIRRELIFGTPKTARSVRTLSLPKRCVSALREHREQQLKERAAAGLKWDPLPHQPNGLVFTTVTGRPTDPRSLNRMLTVLCRQAKVRRVRVHDLRHTCASMLLAQGVDARTLMETLGHSAITMTLDLYAHVMDTTLQEAANRMDDALGEDESGDDDDGSAGVHAVA